MNWTNLYFGMKTMSIIMAVLIFILYLIYAISSFYIKDLILRKNGFEYHKGLGTNVAAEFQSRYTKGSFTIRQKEVDRISLLELRRRIKGK